MSVPAGNHVIGESWRGMGIDVPYNSGGVKKVQCPHCSPQRHKTFDRCLRVNMDQGIAKCYHCGDTFAIQRNNPDAYGSVPQQPTKLKPRRPSYRPAEEFDAASYAAHTWLLNERGIPRSIAKAAQIEARQVWMYSANKDEDGGEEWATAFPYFRGSAVVNIKWRTEDKRFRMERGAELCLYGLNDIESEYLVWVEGEIDKLSLMTAGYPSCVSVPNGAPPETVRDYGAQFAYLEGDTETIMAVKRHIIAVDNDGPGRRLGDELARRLGHAACEVVTWPEGCKDANDVLRQHGPDTLAACVEASRPYPIAGLFDGREGDIHDEFNALYEGGMTGGTHPGDDGLAEYYRIPIGSWTLVTGIPGSGKTEFLNWLSVMLMQREGWRFAVCSPENQPIARHLAQLVQIHVGKPFGAGPIARMTPEERDEGHRWITEHVTFVLPPEDTDDAYSLDNVLALCRAAILRRGVKGVVIDPWNELEHNRPASMREDEYINRSLVKIKRFAREYGVHIWLVAHPRMMHRKKDGEGYEVPTPYDVSGGGQWRNHAMMAITVHREHLGDPAQPSSIHIQKVKRREDGKPGKVDLWYDAATGRYSSKGPVERRYGDGKDEPAPQAPVKRLRQRALITEDDD